MLHEYLKLFDPISHALESAQMNRFVCDTPASQGISSKVDFSSTCPPTPARDVTKIQIEHFPFPHLLHPLVTCILAYLLPSLIEKPQIMAHRTA